MVSAIEKSDGNLKSVNSALEQSSKNIMSLEQSKTKIALVVQKKGSKRDENKAIMLTRRNPNMSIAEIASDLNTALGAH